MMWKVIFLIAYIDSILFVQFASQSSSISPQPSMGLGVQTPGPNTVTSAGLQQQPNSILQQSSQQSLMSSGQKDAGTLPFFFSPLLLLLTLHLSCL